ncbi:MAG: MFS transporter, partial [Pseudolabrys sp.]|nr:MFS transporter [Pseudolabrys sp.]
GIRLFVNALLAVLFFDLLILRLVGDSFFGAAVAIALWGACAWAFMIPQQGRLISVAPQLATLLVALHVTAVYAGTSTAAVFGGLVIVHWGGNWLLVCSAAFVLAGWVASILQEAVSAKAATTQTVPTFSRAKKLSNQGTIEGTTSR